MRRLFSPSRAAAIVAMLAAVGCCAAGLRWGTYAAGGSDSSSYLLSADHLSHGTLVYIDPLGADSGWPGSPAAFAPTGYLATPAPGGGVPIGPMGYPALMAIASVIAGRQAMFWVTPLLGALLVWCTFVLARRVTSAWGALMAAVLTACSPIVLYQVVQPMNDIPAAALWCAALVAGTTPSWPLTRRAAIAGLLCGIALAVRPNLAPLAVVLALGTALLTSVSWRERVTSLVILSLAALPGLAFVLFVQNAMFGSPLRSGYGDLGVLFSAGHLRPNLARYGRWFVETHSAIVVLALPAPLLVPGLERRICVLLLAFIAATFGVYLFYVVFDAWWYLRFLLPAVPLMLILMSTTCAWTAGKVAGRAEGVIVVALAVVMAWFYVHTARAHQVFELRQLEARFRVAGEWVAKLPQNAVILAEYQSGSVRFHGNRPSIRWTEIPPDRLPSALTFLRGRGLKPYLLFERSEEPAFQAQFGSKDPLGTLAWPPVAEIDHVVRVFDPDDYARYMRGEYVKTEQVRSRRLRAP